MAPEPIAIRATIHPCRATTLEQPERRRVAVKVQQSVLQTAATRDELWAEAFVAARIGDPGIVRVLDVGVTLDEHPYYSMELVDGTDLAGVIADGALARAPRSASPRTSLVRPRPRTSTGSSIAI